MKSQSFKKEKTTGRNKTTGKYGSREELIEQVVGFKSRRGMSDSSIARICQVSPGTVSNILKNEAGFLQQGVA
jgi:hypothetical protein